MSRKIVETRTCDVCGEKMQKDGQIWYGGTVAIEENYAGMYSYSNEKHEVDACRMCLAKVRILLKLPQMENHELTPEMEDAVDRAVRNTMRERGR